MQKFIRFTAKYFSDRPYIATEGMNQSVILPANQVLYSGGAFIDSSAMKPYMLEKNHHLCGAMEDYYFNDGSCEVVENPFAHWNRLKSVGMHA